MPAKRRSSDNGDDSAHTSKRRRASSSTKEASEQARTPSRPASDEEKAKLLEWLDSREQDSNLASVFTIEIFPASYGKKKGAKQGQYQVEQLSDGRQVAYRVGNQHEWDQLSKYKKFTLPSGDTYELKSHVLVKNGDSGDDFDADKHWKAQVLEVRALDENHVYLRVVWLEIPRELPGGKKSYHARNELISSNEMAIIDAMSVSGGFKLVHWEEADDEKSPPDIGTYFWRQKINKLNGSLSSLREICKCRTPHNPEHLIIGCTSCAKWLHAQCIIDDRKQKLRNKSIEAAKKNGESSKADGANGADDARSIKQSRAKRTTSEAEEPEEHSDEEDFEVSISIPERDAKPRLLVKSRLAEDEDEGLVEEDVHCLLCHEIIE